MVLCCNLFNQMGWDDSFVIKQGKGVLMYHIVNNEGADTSYIHKIKKNNKKTTTTTKKEEKKIRRKTLIKDLRSRW